MNSSKKIILSILTSVIVLGTLSVGMSIAWYASSTVLYVDNIVIAYRCDQELSISTSIDGEYKESLSFDELNQTGSFMPVSSMYTDKWINQQKNPVFYDASAYMGDASAPIAVLATDGYYSQELYIKCDVDAYLTIDTGINLYGGNSNVEGSTYISPNKAKNKNQEELDKLTQAMRFSFLVKKGVDEDVTDDDMYVIIDPNKDENKEEVLLGGILDNNFNSHYYFDSYESDNERYETIYGEITNRDKAIYDETLKEDSEFIYPNLSSSAFNAKHQAGVHPLNLQASLENGLEIKKENAYSLQELEEELYENSFKEPEEFDTFTFRVNKNEPKRIVLSIYIEGWDLDSVNSTMGASFLAGTSFKIYRPIVK